MNRHFRGAQNAINICATFFHEYKIGSKSVMTSYANGKLNDRPVS